MPLTDEADRYLNLRELAQYAGLSEGTLRRLLPRGLPHYRIGVRILVKRSEFDAWLQAGQLGALETRATVATAADRIGAMAEAAVRAIRGEH